MGSGLIDSFCIFESDVQKLTSSVNDASGISELDVNQIIPLYYQVMTVKSLGEMLLKKLSDSDGSASKIKKITQTHEFISEKFDLELHVSIQKQLEDSVNKISEQLRSNSSTEKSRDEIESEAKMYDALRQIMSTKEFVEQYQKGLFYD